MIVVSSKKGVINKNEYDVRSNMYNGGRDDIDELTKIREDLRRS